MNIKQNILYHKKGRNGYKAVKRKILTCSFALLVTIGAIMPNVQASASNQVLISSSTEVEGKTYLDLDPKGKDLNEDNYEETTVSIEKMEVKRSKITIEGALSYDDEESTFSLSGELKSGNKSNRILVGNLEDKNDNFDVIHFSIDSENDRTITLDKKKGEKVKKNNEVLLKLYLMKKGTRDFTVIEVENPKFIDSKLFKVTDKLESAEHRDQYWYSKILEPEIEIIEEEDTPKNISADGEFSTMALQSHGITTVHKFRYEVAGDTWTEKFNTRRTIEGPDRISSSGEFVVKFYVTEEETSYEDRYGDVYIVDDETSTAIGRFGDTIVQGWVESDEVIQTVEWDGSYKKPGFFSDPEISIGWSVGLLGVSIGPSTSWNKSEFYEAMTMKAFDNTSGKYTKNAAVVWKEDSQVLNEPGHTFDHVFRVGTYDTSGYKDFNVQFSYTIDNPMDERDTVKEYDREISLTYRVR